MFAKPEMGSVRCRVHKMRRRPWPSAARVRPTSVPARTPRDTRTPAMTGRRVAWPGLSSSPALTRRTPTKRSALRLRRGRRTPLVVYAPSLSCAPPGPKFAHQTASREQAICRHPRTHDRPADSSVSKDQYHCRRLRQDPARSIPLDNELEERVGYRVEIPQAVSVCA